jgi:winged helix DNA-binding protein
VTSGPLSLRALNRALLDRQLLLRPAALAGAGGAGGAGGAAGAGDRSAPVIETVEHLVGLQAQAPFPPYYGLWSWLDGFRPGDLAGLLTGRQVVRVALMRGTIHLVSARDCLALRPALQPVLDRGLRANFGRRLTGVDLAALAVAGRALVDEKPRTFSDLGRELARQWPERDPDALAQGVRALVPLVQVPPRGVWGASGRAAHTSAQAWLGRPMPDDVSLESLVTRYLAAFGPATVADVQAWSGLTRLGEIVDRLRPGLRTFRGEPGADLFDLPGAPRPDPERPAPVRFVAEFDNLVLAHADRARVLSEPHRKRMYARANTFPGSVLIDGFVAGIWKITRPRPAAALTVELFENAPARIKDEVSAEGRRLLAFAAPEAGDQDVRFAPLP